MSYIDVIDLVKEYKTGEVITRANDEINFSIEKGEFVVILGPSGAGKSTTLNILGGMDHPTSGQLIIDGKDISGYSDRELTTYRRQSVGFVFQNYNLVPNLTVKENVQLMIEITKSDADLDYILEHTGLAHRADNFPAQLSGGEQQRVSIARAIAGNPKLLLCDEPTGALDEQTGRQVLELLQETSIKQGTTVLVITHNRQISEMADRVIEIRNGKVDRQEVNEHPKHVSEISW